MNVTTKLVLIASACIVGVIVMVWLEAALPARWSSACAFTAVVLGVIAAPLLVLVAAQLMDGNP